ncbi:chromatin remodelling complex Rsc7/Swp82 subunit-domain-containing protein [Pyronema omphalodes]|nr:chromatin remodelling complex Rsc7/Swp82 subunit-domain-containing protein [Pyronema omphalodes]
MARRKSSAADADPPSFSASRSVSPPSAIDDTSPSTPLENDIDQDVDTQEPSNPPTPVPFTPVPIRRKRGRPSRAAIEERNRLSTPRGDADPEDFLSEANTPSATPFTARGKRRGRPPAPGKNSRARGGPSHHTQIPLDKDGNPQSVENDEIVLDEDPLGVEKVDEDGYLKGGREYRCRTFTILGRGKRLYMLSTEPARCIGFRDSYLFFQKHKQLFKIITEPDEKYDLIKRDLIPHSYKGRAIGVVTARSVFREFGARIIVGGKRVVDDFWESKALEEGAIEGELADPADVLPGPGEEYNRNQYVAWHGASSVYHTGQPSVPSQAGAQQQKRKKVIVTDTNWMAAHAAAAQSFNAGLRTFRQHNVPERGVYEPHSNQMHFPRDTQPTGVKWEKVDAKVPMDTVIFEERLEHKPWIGRGLGVTVGELGTGFGEWDESVIDALETEEEKEAVRAQVRLERQWAESF